MEFRNGMINVSPVGRNASQEERDQFLAFDKEAGLRKKMVEALKQEFPDFGLTYVFQPFFLGWVQLVDDAYLRLAVTRLVAKYRSTFSRMAGIRLTVSSTFKPRKTVQMELITRPFTSLEISHSKVATTGKFTAIQGQLDIR